MGALAHGKGGQMGIWVLSVLYGFWIKGKDIANVSGVARIMQVHGMFKHITIGGDKLEGDR